MEIALIVAGILHFGILIASALVPRVLDWRTELARLSALSRHLIWVHGAFIVLVIVGFGIVTLVARTDLAGGSLAGRAFCAFVAVFWLARLCVQLFLFDARPYLTHAVYQIGYHGLTAVFTYLAAVYGVAAVM
jgi:hypothetical protein